jgi:hypothetical protein
MSTAISSDYKVVVDIIGFATSAVVTGQSCLLLIMTPSSTHESSPVAIQTSHPFS